MHHSYPLSTKHLILVFILLVYTTSQPMLPPSTSPCTLPPSSQGLSTEQALIQLGTNPHVRAGQAEGKGSQQL